VDRGDSSRLLIGDLVSGRPKGYSAINPGGVPAGCLLLPSLPVSASPLPPASFGPLSVLSFPLSFSLSPILFSLHSSFFFSMVSFVLFLLRKRRFHERDDQKIAFAYSFHVPL